MRTTDITTTGGNDQFYPTPPSVADQMLQGLDFNYIQSVLEPSAGKGDLIYSLMSKFISSASYCRRSEICIDACEIDPYLRQICKYNFSDDKKIEICDQQRPLREKRYSSLTTEEERLFNLLENEINIIRSAAVHIVHDDFLSYRTYKHYDLILMNPPFSDGDKHLLKAIEMQRSRGGIVICLLNAETIRNPYSLTRQELKRQLAEFNADIKYIDDAFSTDAERKADVDVAIVKVVIPQPETEESSIWERMKKAEEAKKFEDAEIHDLVAGDYIERAIQYYNIEVSATLKLVEEYMALVPYMGRKLKANDSFDKTPILSLTVGDDSYLKGFNLDKYLRTVRLKYWSALMTNKDFTGKLTSDLQKTYRENVERMADYEFSAFNIKQIMLEMNASISQGVQKAILDLFEKFTAEHSWYPECSKNRHYFNGWATNKAHKVGKKVIYPVNLFRYSYIGGKEDIDAHHAYGVISDLEKVFDYLGGKRPEGYNLSEKIAFAEQGCLRNVEFAYFKVDFFKKGTIHIKFLPETMPLVDRLNIYAAQHRNWLPPNYGKASYDSMTRAEKEVVDSFHGDGSEGSGKTMYKKVMSSSSFYLADPAEQSTMPMLTEAT